MWKPPHELSRASVRYAERVDDCFGELVAGASVRVGAGQCVDAAVVRQRMDHDVVAKDAVCGAACYGYAGVNKCQNDAPGWCDGDVVVQVASMAIWPHAVGCIESSVEVLSGYA